MPEWNDVSGKTYMTIKFEHEMRIFVFLKCDCKKKKIEERKV